MTSADRSALPQPQAARVAGTSPMAAASARAARSPFARRFSSSASTRDVLFLLVPAVVVGDQGEGRVADLRLPGELRLGEVRHADDVHAPRPVEARLGARRERGALHAEVGSRRRARGRPASLPPRREQHAAQLGADRVGNGDVRRRCPRRRRSRRARASDRRTDRGRPRRRGWISSRIEPTADAERIRSTPRIFIA